MKTARIAAALPIIAAGPIVTLYLCMRCEARLTVTDLLTWIVVAVAVSAAAHLAMKGDLLATVISVPVSEIIYVLIALTYVHCMAEGRQRAETLAWLPVLIPFLLFFGFPTALSVSFGTGLMVRGLRDFRESERTQSRDLARRLIKDDQKLMDRRVFGGNGTRGGG